MKEYLTNKEVPVFNDVPRDGKAYCRTAEGWIPAEGTVVVVELGGDEIVNEEYPVMIQDKDTGEIRQKKDSNGDPVWGFIYEYTGSMASGTQESVNVIDNQHFYLKLLGAKYTCADAGDWKAGNIKNVSLQNPIGIGSMFWVFIDTANDNALTFYWCRSTTSGSDQLEARVEIEYTREAD
jgi:hypothetical protein